MILNQMPDIFYINVDENCNVKNLSLNMKNRPDQVENHKYRCNSYKNKCNPGNNLKCFFTFIFTDYSFIISKFYDY